MDFINVFRDNQVFLLALFGCVCFFNVIFGLIMKVESAKRKLVIVLLELTTGIMMFAEMLTHTYKGNNSDFGMQVLYFSNFLAYALVYFAMLGFVFYLRTYIPHYDMKSKTEFYGILVCTDIGLFMLVLSQFNGMYYTIDAEGYYKRGELYALSYVAPFVIFVLTLQTILVNRKQVSRLIFASFVTFAILPIVCSIIQGFMYGVDLMNLAVGVSATVLYALALLDQNILLNKISYREMATGLPNGHGFVLEIEKRRIAGIADKYTAVYFDIVAMGILNRKYGSINGDKIIIEYAKKISSSMHEKEILGRLGGNYFVALVMNDNIDEFLKLIEGVDIDVEIENNNITLKIAAVAGVYRIKNGDNPEEIMGYITLGVNQAKNVKKKPYVFVDDEFLEDVYDSQKIQSLVAKGIKNREFKPYYQPKVDVRTRKLCGAEALVRWEHDGEIIPPFKFIPLMEQNDSICKFDFYMLEYVCMDIKKWIDEGLNPPIVSVNFSRRNLSNEKLAEEIYNITKEIGIPPEFVQIEITETLDEYPLDCLKGVVNSLRVYGMSTAIDDFGTGSSSIKMVKDVSFDVLKVDKSFVDYLGDKERKILKHIISMAHEIGISVITEGVETKEQVEILTEMECNEIQGYYFDKPLERNAFERRIVNPVYQ